MQKDLILIETKQDCAIYGRVINTSGKIGQFEVVHDYWGGNGEIYHTYAEAEHRRYILSEQYKKHLELVENQGIANRNKKRGIADAA